MSQRGTSGRARARPNLSLSGVLSGSGHQENERKKKDKNDSDNKEKKQRERRSRSERGRGGNERGRGRNRGARGGSKIVQTEGIFSSGLGDDGPQKSRIKKEANLTGTEEILETTAVNVEMGTGLGTVDSEGRKLPTTYEEEWQSDEDADNVALEELEYSTVFIDDIERMQNPPIVLPPHESIALKDLLDIDEEEEEKRAERNKIPDVKVPLYILSDNEILSSVKASGYFRKLLDDNDDSFFSFQLPATLRVIGDYANINFNKKLDENAHCLELLDSNIEIGKLKFLKNGRVYMDIGGNRLDVGAAIPSGYTEDLIMIENPNKQTHIVTEDGIKMEIDASPEVNKRNKACNEEDILHVISPVKTHLIAYHDLVSLCEKNDSKSRSITPMVTEDSPPVKIGNEFRSKLIDKLSRITNDQLRFSEENNV
ncbi:DNA-directed RNA polymerase III subunit RPC4 family-containing protein [Strongyloides ratti]|uniref:DNA-directed RNA polymerase III subunit RPC4 family-containing protein n=1 Tax=Strongyloides ratti TaxID=34506 RepID=A0A090L978_STRRB|nr:DNA-directed RNA polymerase III subunit RPC4 family-containing protein [Strongyloides ratti]CEF66336.1 DNA-directed RNA polymerase III subunit RPC4 family-containing protein [Strongyloides ratti]